MRRSSIRESGASAWTPVRSSVGVADEMPVTRHWDITGVAVRRSLAAGVTVWALVATG